MRPSHDPSVKESLIMTMKTWHLAALPVALFAFAMPFTACNQLEGAQSALCCKEFTAGADLSAVDFGLSGEANLKFHAFAQASADFSGTASAMITDIGGACKNIAEDLGGDTTKVTEKDPAARAKAFCDLATAQIKAQVTAKGSISVNFQPPVCTVDASIQGSCEASCSGSASCEVTPGEIVARCDPGKLSGKCSGECKGSCEGSANLAVDCSGSCGGTCEGKCDGKDSSGSCKGTCEGKCRGSCTAKAGATMKCSADCTGGCSVEYKAPKCTADLKPPKAECNANVDCSGQCKASASAKATCTEPSVSIVADASIDASAIGSLQTNLPKIIGVFKGKLSLVKANAQAVVDAGASLGASGDITGSAHAAACLIPAVNAIGQAFDNIKASGEASISVLGSVGVN
jgi:hypothetical protein